MIYLFRSHGNRSFRIHTDTHIYMYIDRDRDL